MQILSIQIIDPDTKAPVSLEDWKKESDPTRAEWILIETDELKPFLLHKKLADGWTCEEDSEPQCNATSAWLVHLNYGGVANPTKTTGFQVRLVAKSKY